MKSITNLISRTAKSNAKIKEYKSEWILEYSLLIFTKIVISFISIYTSYTYLFNLSYPFLSTFTISATITLLIIIEAFSMLLVSKFSKHLLRGRYLNSVFLLPIVLSVFCVSFILSTNGIAQLTSSKTSNITAITDEYRTNKTNIEQTYSVQIGELKTQIVTIKQNPSGWKGHKRCILVAEQLTQINNYQNSISELRQLQRDELTKLKDNYLQAKQTDLNIVTNRANDYYVIVGGLLGLQFVLSFIVVFMSKIIYRNDETENFILQDIQAWQSDMVERAASVILSQSKALSNTALQAFETINIVSEPSSLSVVAKANKSGNELKSEPEETDKEAPQQKIIGFNIATQKDEITTTKEQMDEALDVERTTLNVDNTKEIKDTKGIDARTDVDINKPTIICLNCEKEVVKRSHNMKFCCENCRLDHYERTTGKNVSRFKNKK